MYQCCTLYCVRLHVLCFVIQLPVSHFFGFVSSVLCECTWNECWINYWMIRVFYFIFSVLIVVLPQPCLSLNFNFSLLVQSPVALCIWFEVLSRFYMHMWQIYYARSQKTHVYPYTVFSSQFSVSISVDGLVSNLGFFFGLFRCSRKWKWRRHIFQWIR